MLRAANDREQTRVVCLVMRSERPRMRLYRKQRSTEEGAVAWKEVGKRFTTRKLECVRTFKTDTSTEYLDDANLLARSLPGA